MGMALNSKGQAAEALSYIRTGMRLDPNYPETFLWFLGQALFGAERYEEAAVPWRAQQSSTQTMRSCLPCSAPPMASSAERKTPRPPLRASTNAGSSAAPCR